MSRDFELCSKLDGNINQIRIELEATMVTMATTLFVFTVANKIYLTVWRDKTMRHFVNGGQALIIGKVI
jgi:hypothetical protein